MGALEAYTPTLMVGVPKVWETIKRGVQGKLATGSPVMHFLVQMALEWQSFCLSHGFDGPLVPSIQSALGSLLCMALSRGGHLNAKVQQFLQVVFGIVLVQGYGLTKMCAVGMIQAIDDWNIGIVGVPIQLVEIKLILVNNITDPAGQPYQCTDCHDMYGNTMVGHGEVCIWGGW